MSEQSSVSDAYASTAATSSDGVSGGAAPIDGPSLRTILSTRAPAPVVGITVFQGRVFVALSDRVCELVDGVLKPLKFELEPEEVINRASFLGAGGPPHRPRSPGFRP